MEKRYIQTFETSESLQEALDNNELGKPYVAYLVDEQRIVWYEVPPTPPEPVYSAMPLTFEIVSAGTLVFGTVYSTGYELIRTIYVKINDGEWTETRVGPSSYGQQVTYNLNAGDKLQIKASYPKWGYDDAYPSFSINGTSYFNLYGNIMSLVDKDNFAEITSLDSTVNYAFGYLFGNLQTGANVIDASKLCLPATGLSSGCYYGMFMKCADLTNAPVLPATTLAVSCYENMFYGCTNLNYAKCLATDISASNCTSFWVYGVSSTGTFVKNPNMSSWASGDDGIPTGWTVIDATI